MYASAYYYYEKVWCFFFSSSSCASRIGSPFLYHIPRIGSLTGLQNCPSPRSLRTLSSRVVKREKCPCQEIKQIVGAFPRHADRLLILVRLVVFSMRFLLIVIHPFSPLSKYRFFLAIIPLLSKSFAKTFSQFFRVSLLFHRVERVISPS